MSVRRSVCPSREVTGCRLDPESPVGVSKHRGAWTRWRWQGRERLVYHCERPRCPVTWAREATVRASGTCGSDRTHRANESERGDFGCPDSGWRLCFGLPVWSETSTIMDAVKLTRFSWWRLTTEPEEANRFDDLFQYIV